jgi:hypothetical protein
MTIRLRATWLLFLLAASLCSLSAARAEITITLQNEFIEFYKGRATIQTNFLVDKAHKKPNSPSKDGDLHIAGRADEVKLPIVAEIMNAKDDKPAVEAIHDSQGTGQPIALDGAWRLWCEHGGNSEQIQGQPLEPFTSTNPDHVFEVHPVTAIDGRSLLPTLKPIAGFKTKDAHDAFTTYENVRCRIIPEEGVTTLLTSMAGYNYVEFIMEINSEFRDLNDGRMVFCKVLDLDGELLVRNRRMVLIADSEVERQTRDKPIGTRVHVLGLPRINLSLVSWRVRVAADGRQEVLTWNLPYEIIVVGFYGFPVLDDEEADANVVRPARRAAGFVPRTLTGAELNRIWRMPAGPERDPQADRDESSSPVRPTTRPARTPPVIDNPRGAASSRALGELIEDR